MLEKSANMNNSISENKNATSKAYEEYSPDCDIEETKDAFVVSMDMPGLDVNAIKIELDRDMLCISGMADVEGLRARLYKREFRVMRGVDASKVKADYKLGVLSVTLPKPEAQQARQIKIECE